eukprot:SAG11_NODE_4208_length_2013_cov_14.928945_1_plen_185_part_00
MTSHRDPHRQSISILFSRPVVIKLLLYCYAIVMYCYVLLSSPLDKLVTHCEERDSFCSSNALLVFCGERIYCKYEYKDIIKKKKWFAWHMGVVTYYDDDVIEVSFDCGDQHDFHPRNDYWLLKYADDHYKYSGCPSKDQLILDRSALKRAEDTLRNCLANGKKKVSGLCPEQAIDLTVSSDEED